jgi:hypothetical protein
MGSIRIAEKGIGVTTAFKEEPKGQIETEGESKSQFK